MLKALMNLGLTKTNARVYILLATKAPQKATAIAVQLGMPKQQVYRSLKTLRNRGMVNANSERPILFSAVSLEKALDLVIEAKKEEAQAVQQHKDEILSTLQTAIQGETAQG
jgi:sugar-specific transcriptional regulator TrmB